MRFVNVATAWSSGSRGLTSDTTLSGSSTSFPPSERALSLFTLVWVTGLANCVPPIPKSLPRCSFLTRIAAFSGGRVTFARKLITPFSDARFGFHEQTQEVLYTPACYAHIQRYCLAMRNRPPYQPGDHSRLRKCDCRVQRNIVSQVVPITMARTLGLQVHRMMATAYFKIGNVGRVFHYQALQNPVELTL